MPKNIHFHSYGPRDQITGKKTKNAAQRELLLHSTSHPNLDYTAKEEVQRGSKLLVNHFFGIYDPKTGKMQVIEAKKMVVRGAVRSKQAAEAEAAEKKMNQVCPTTVGSKSGLGANPRQTNFERRTDLGHTFGTKKAKKKLQEVTMNAIAPQKAPSDDGPTRMDAASKAMLSSVGKITSTMATREDLQSVVDEAKPVPKPNLDAEDIEDVYDPKVIIGADVLNLVPIREWQEKAQHGESIQVGSRYVAARVARLATNAEATTRLRVLRYLYFTLMFYLHTRPGKERGSRSVPPRDKLHQLLSPAPEAVVENIRRKFSDAGIMRKFHIDLLLTHCCAFACMVDNFDVDTQNLRDDLKLDQKGINQYFHEIGGRVKPTKQGGRTIHRAVLALPLDFPKQRSIAPKRR